MPAGFTGLGAVATVRARPGRFSSLSIFLSEPFLCGGLVWAHRALNSTKRRVLARMGQDVGQLQLWRAAQDEAMRFIWDEVLPSLFSLLSPPPVHLG
jgi:hypothetical protein